MSWLHLANKEAEHRRYKAPEVGAFVEGAQARAATWDVTPGKLPGVPKEDSLYRYAYLAGWYWMEAGLIEDEVLTAEEEEA